MNQIHVEQDRAPIELGRRRFLGYVVAAPTLVVAADLGVDTRAAAPPARSSPPPGRPSSTTSRTCRPTPRGRPPA